MASIFIQPPAATTKPVFRFVPSAILRVSFAEDFQKRPRIFGGVSFFSRFFRLGRGESTGTNRETGSALEISGGLSGHQEKGGGKKKQDFSELRER